MKQEVAEKWVAALRSGEYQQGHGRLRDTNTEEVGGDKQITPGARFCCLGVLCDLYAKEHPNAQWIPETDPGEDECLFAPDITSAHVAADGDKFVLPSMVRDWSGVRETDGTPSTLAAADELRKFNSSALTEANDRNVTFRQIADFVEQNWQAL